MRPNVKIEKVNNNQKQCRHRNTQMTEAAKDHGRLTAAVYPFHSTLGLPYRDVDSALPKVS